MKKNIEYGDENLGYRIIAREITPEQADFYIKQATEKNLINEIHTLRLNAFKKRALEKI